MPNNYTNIAICSPGWEFDCGKFNKQHAKTCLCEAVKPMPTELRDVPAASYPDGTTERSRRGLDDDWYTWANREWGTKWGTYDIKAFSLGGDGSPVAIKFQTAWGPPKILPEIADWLKTTFGFQRVAFVGFDPYDDTTKMLYESERAEAANVD